MSADDITIDDALVAMAFGVGVAVVGLVALTLVLGIGAHIARRRSRR